MTDKRVREIQPGEPDQPSIMPDESCEDADDFFLAIANRNKLKDDDINALPPGEEEALLQAILAEEASTNTINQDDDEEDADDTADSAKEVSSSIVDAPVDDDEQVDHEAGHSQPVSPEPEPEPPKQSPPKSPSRHQSPSNQSPPSRPKPASSPAPAAAPQAKPADPVAAYAERRSREEMEKEKEETEKRELLTRFYEFEEAGVPCPKRFTLKSDLQEMRFEFKKLDDEFNRKKSIQMWKDGIKLLTNAVEVLNKRFDPIGWKATDFSDNLNLKLNEADWALRELHKKYFRRGGKPSPELALLFIVGTVALDTHKSNSKKEEQRQQKANATAHAHPHAAPPGYPYAYPPPGYTGYPPMYWNPAMQQQPRQAQPGQQPQQQPPQAAPQHQPGAARPSVQMPPQQQAPQQRPGVVINPHGIPGTSPTHSTQSPQMPLVVDQRPVAAAIPTPMPSPQQPSDAPKRRTLRPPADSGADLGGIAGIMGGMAGMGGPGSAAAPTRKTSNYGPQAVIDEDEQPKPTTQRRLPVEPPIDASPPEVRFDNATGELVFA